MLVLFMGFLLGGGSEVLPKGYAYALDSETLMFEEQRVSDGAEQQKIKYVGKDGSVWMEKEVDFSQSRTRPHYSSSDLRNERFESIEVSGDRVKMVYETATKRKERQVPLPTGLVVDAGFEHFVAGFFGNLLAGETLVLRFAVPSRGKCYPFKLRMVGETELAGQHGVILRMVPENALFRLFVDPMEMVYHRDEQRLLRYEGMTGVTNLKGKYIAARIVFPRPGEKPEDYL